MSEKHDGGIGSIFPAIFSSTMGQPVGSGQFVQSAYPPRDLDALYETLRDLINRQGFDLQTTHQALATVTEERDALKADLVSCKEQVVRERQNTISWMTAHDRLQTERDALKWHTDRPNAYRDAHEAAEEELVSAKIERDRWQARAAAFEVAHAEAVEYIKACRIGWMDRAAHLAVAEDLARRYPRETEAKQEQEQAPDPRCSARYCPHAGATVSEASPRCILPAGHAGVCRFDLAHGILHNLATRPETADSVPSPRLEEARRLFSEAEAAKLRMSRKDTMEAREAMWRAVDALSTALLRACAELDAREGEK